MTATREDSPSLVHLTFDDGPDPVWTPRVLEALRRAKVRATFFVVAPAAARYPALISTISEAGHGVEFHCTEHVRHSESSRAGIEADTHSGLRTLFKLGATPRLWRPPWGVMAPWTTEVAKHFSLELALWTADTHDWRGDSTTEMLVNIDDGLSPGSVVLMHDGIGPGALRSDCEETVALIPQLTERVQDLGLEPAPLSPNRLPPLEALPKASV